jgi:5'-phosphate synthase pdxT subunit
MKVGILAIQGAYIEHAHILEKLGIDSTLVKKKEDLEGIDALILPGGESTTMGLLLVETGLITHIQNFRKPIWGTCAGLILLANNITGSKINGQTLIQMVPITVQRNAYGHAKDSFIQPIDFEGIGVFEGVFIRAPVISPKVGPDVQILAMVNDQIAAIRYENILGTTFHPELTTDTRVHQYFIDMVTDFAKTPCDFP